MPGTTFAFSHVLIAIFAAGLAFCLKKIYLTTKIRFIKYISASTIGMIAGIAAGYAGAHIVTPMIIFTQPMIKSAGIQSCRFVFWSIFIIFSMIGIIAGWLTGILYARKKEEESENYAK